ncbi:hypothetical protein M3Y97_00952600 [Aphelenchoides bicaudatus]|nr:hypothetical protein M3Y97_00952600 [Aphelenchoides bicaudatus]
MSDKEKEPAQKEEDESEDESQLKIVEEEAPSQSGQEKEDHEEPTTTSKAELTSPTMNNNNELASPSTSSQKAGGSGMGLGKGPKNVQPNFDFDYEGPPVTVSNGMALELVNRFGLNNAWGAFLKLKGYHTPYDKNAPQPPEHVQALKRFRRKIRTVREMFNSHRDKNEDTNPLMSKEFVILLKTSNGNEGGGDSEHAGDDSTIADAPIASTSMEKKPKSKKKQEEVSASVTQPITVQIDNGQAVDANTSSNGAVPADPTHPKRPRKSTKKDTKRDSVIAAATSSNTMSSNHASTSTNAKNQSKIDEIVSGVIDRVMAANQKDSSKGGQAPESIPQTAQMLPPTLGVEQLQELYRLNPALFNTFNAQQGSISGVQSLLSTVKSSTALNPSVTAPLQLNTGTHQANPAKLLLHGLPGQQQPAFLDSQTAQLFFPPSTQTPLNTPAIGAFGVASPFLNTAAIRAALHQHHGPLGAQVFPGSVTLQGAPGQLVPHWLGQLETSVGLPQQLLAPVSQSTSSQKHSAHSGTSTDKPLTINVQQTEDDEDEDESEQKIDVTVSPMTNKSGSKANHKEDTLKMDTKGRKPSRASTTMSATNSTKEGEATVA